jgi:putative SOS response-associated peptidase YedK
MLLGRVYEVIERCRRSLRYLVPANSFAEYAPEPNPETKKKDAAWFALNEDWPLFAYAGIWTTHGVCEVLRNVLNLIL